MNEWIKMIIEIVFFRYGEIFVYLMTAIVGIILSKRSGKAGSVRIIGGILLLAAAYLAAYFLPFLLGSSQSQIAYFLVLFGCHMIRYVAMLAAFKVFCEYMLSRWVGLIYIISTVVCFFYCLFRVRVIYGMTNIVNGIDNGTSFLMAFFNNQSAINSVGIILIFVPAIILCIDGFLTIKKKG